MKSLPKHQYLEFNPDTFINVRKEFNLDKQERMVEAIDILEDWIKKQNHFVKKDFSREYLERALITSKGLVERAKTRIDNMCTFRTLMPDFYQDLDLKKIPLSHILYHAILPKLTKDDLRIYAEKVHGDDINSSDYIDFYKYMIIISEYLKLHEYCKGFLIIIDYSDINIAKLVKNLNPIAMQQAITILTDGYGMRISGIHFITPSKLVDLAITIYKQIISTKLANRIHVHKNLHSLYEYAPKEILPAEFGGSERPLKELHEKWLEILGSEEHKEYLKEMNKASTNDSHRQSGQFNEQYLGIPGSFRSLSVD